MQPITWNKEEIQASVQKKLAMLRAMGPGNGRTLDQRLALAKDRIAFDETCQLAEQRHAAMHGTPWTVGGSPVMARIVDDGTDDQGESTDKPVRGGFTAADDSYASTFTLSASARTTKPDGPASADQDQPAPDPLPSQLPVDPGKTAIQYDPDDLSVAQKEAERRRLFEENARLSSKDWVVLDRASVLQCLSVHAEGLTLVQLAAQLLGAASSPRDTRRLSAMMKREEDRQTVTRSGRGQPIRLSDLGKTALAELDVKAENQRMTDIRAKRVYAQRLRLQGLRPGPVKKSAAAKTARPPKEQP